MEVRFTFDANGNLRGETIPKLGENAEIGMRAQFSQLNAQNRARAEEQIMAASGFDGRGQLQIQGVPVDLTRPFGYRMAFQAEDYADFSVAGGMAVPDPPGGESVRGLYATASAPANDAVLLQCQPARRDLSPAVPGQCTDHRHPGQPAFQQRRR